MQKFAIALIGLATFASVPAAAAVTVFSENFESGVNGGFGSFAASGNVAVASGADYGPPANGFTFNSPAAAANHFAAFGVGNSFTSGTILASTIPAAVGGPTLYTVDFDAGRIGLSALEDLNFLATDQFGHSVQAALIPPGMGTMVVDNVFSHFQYQFTGTGPISLTFSGNGTPGDNTDVLLDNVLVRAGAIPEASTWAMMLVGFGSVGAMTRRRRSTRKAMTLGLARD